MKTIQKQHQIVLVPTYKDSELYFNKNENKFQICQFPKPSTPLKPNHFCYILSDEEVKEGDCILQVLPSGNYKIHSNISLESAKISNEDGLDIKKIIATTNSKLNLDTFHKGTCKGDKDCSKECNCLTLISKGLSKPTEQFIQQWIDNGTPEFINVEFDFLMCPKEPKCINCHSKCGIGLNLKISSDNTINCSLIENKTYTKQELIHLLKKASKFGIYEDEYMDDWIKENK